jgi:hypothetical protein
MWGAPQKNYHFVVATGKCVNANLQGVRAYKPFPFIHRTLTLHRDIRSMEADFSRVNCYCRVRALRIGPMNLRSVLGKAMWAYSGGERRLCSPPR